MPTQSADSAKDPERPETSSRQGPPDSGAAHTVVLHILWDFSMGGLERLVHELSREIDRERFETHILTLGELGALAAGTAEFAVLHEAPIMSRASLLMPVSLARVIRGIQPDIVHTHSGVWYKGVRAARMAGVPSLVHTDHGRIPGLSTLDLGLERWAAQHTDRIVAVSDGIADFFRDEFRCPERRILTLKNGVDTDRFAPIDRRVTPPAWIPDDADVVIGSVGRLDPVKGFDLMLRALAMLRSARPELRAQLVIVGDGPERAALTSLADELGIEDLVSILGWVDDVEDRLGWFDIFSLSSHTEGTSLSLLEAMAAGVCPVITDVGGNGAVLGPDLEHRLVAAGDPAELCRAWARAIDMPREREVDGHTALTRVVEHFGVGSMVAEYEKLYDSLTSSASAES